MVCTTMTFCKAAYTKSTSTLSPVSARDKIDHVDSVASCGDKIDCTVNLVADTVDSVDFDRSDRVEVDFVARQCVRGLTPMVPDN